MMHWWPDTAFNQILYSNYQEGFDWDLIPRAEALVGGRHCASEGLSGLSEYMLCINIEMQLLLTA